MHGIPTMMKCPGSTEDWRQASMTLQCRKPYYYHCLLDEKGQITQKCLQRMWIEKDKCPKYNTNVERLDVYQCKSSENNCPTTVFFSNQVFKYPGCFQNVSSIVSISATSLTIAVATTNEIPVATANEIKKQDSESANDISTTKNAFHTTPILPIIIPCIIVGVLLVLFLVGYIFFRRRNRSELTEINTGGGQTDNQSPEEENMLQELRLSNTDKKKGHNDNSNIFIKEGYSHNPGLKPENDSTSLDEQLGELVEEIKENKMEKKRIVFCLLHKTADENKIAEAARTMGENVVGENDFNKWMKNKSQRMYVLDLLLSGQEKCIKELKKTLIDVLQSVIKNDTKFVIIFPLSIWSKDQKLQEIWRGCPVCKISYLGINI